MGKKKVRPLSGQQNGSILSNSYPTFFIVKRISSNKDTFHGVSPFLVENYISDTVGEVKSIKKLLSGDLLVEVASSKQSQQILKLKSMSTIPVSVSPHETLNTSKGVITCGELFYVPLDEITEKLQSQGVSHVRRITIRRDGQLLNTKHLILTFSSHVLPEYVKAGYMRLSVRPYIPNSLRCFKCQRFGHSQTSCRGTLTCARCAEVGHESTGCTAKEKCVNCKGDHTSFSRNCLAWKLEKEIVATKVKNQISYPEARKIVVSKAPTAGKTATVHQSPHSISEQVLPLPSTSLVVKNAPIPVCDDASTSQDLAGFKTVTKKEKTKTQSEPTDVKQNESRSESSKFWTTSPLQVSTSTIRQVITSLQSEDALKKPKRTNEVGFTHLNPDSESMLVDGNYIKRTDNAIESSTAEDAINYDPNETIEECPPVVEEQQPSPHQTPVDKSILKQRLKKSPFRWVDFKAFYGINLSTSVHDKYLKRHEVKRLLLQVRLQCFKCFSKFVFCIKCFLNIFACSKLFS
ncbi:hypothetical protein AVEN_38692-1 [Araneus ventricosus]|uniref:CCHC-type domain-containing protein n=1 Tax=Araneus ventricosus TaxID=182803 RepID=A0A4Y2WY12_ARAVE|nr:hypothetical protein AVEN_38692-1 [Araneus ventricosus]